MSVARSFNRDYENEKDYMISSLRKQVFDLEQNEKNYNILNSKFKNLQNEYSVVCENKLKQEYEYKSRLESANKEILDVRSEIDSIQQTLDERINLNKKLYQDNSALHKLAEDRANEIANLKDQIHECKINVESLTNNKINLEKDIQITTNDLSNQKDLNDKLIDDNEKLAKMLDNQDENIRSLESDRKKLNMKIDELNFELSNLNNKLKNKEDALSNLTRKYDELTRSNNQLESRYSDLDSTNERIKNELSITRKELGKEKNTRLDCERSNEKLEVEYKDKEREIRNLLIDMDNLKHLNSKVNDEKVRQFGEIEKLKSHIMVLTEQNQKYVDEIEATIDQDEKIRQQLAMRRDANDNLIINNKLILDRSLNNLDEFLNRSLNAKVSSPNKFSASRMNNASINSK